MAASKKKPIADFEKSLGELEKIVKRMEQGEQSLDDTIQDFERGMALSELCRKGLDEAQQKVEMLVKKHGDYRLEIFSGSPTDMDHQPRDDEDG